jgi:hypothetical protein
MNLPRTKIHWAPRNMALAPAGVAAVGETARALALRLLRSDFAGQLSRLRGAATEDSILLLGESADLPWVDGAIYLGKDSGARSLLVPTTLAPSVPIDALERALIRRFAELSPPIVVLPVQRRIFSAAPALPLSHPHLARWLEGKQ